jgi:SHS2 domain-containing protein
VRSFEFFDHAADVGITARGDSLPELFEAAAAALAAWIGPPPQGSSGGAIDIELTAEDYGDLLVRWLQEILYLFSVRRLYFNACERFELEGQSLRARVTATEWSEAESRQFQEVKAVTYHNLRVAQEEEGRWVARVILDI